MLVFIACGGKESATTQSLSKDNSVEIVVTNKHLNEKYDVIRTTRRVYLQNKLIKEVSSFDTIPALGRANVQDEDDNKIKSVQKEYDIFVTVQ
jgi:galactitol-specific phosphotransferase system IIB component